MSKLNNHDFYFRFKRGLAANVAALAGLLYEGEPVITTDTHALYIGDASNNPILVTNITGSGTVANLATVFPSPVIGMRYMVTNALAPAFGSPVAGSGTVTVPVVYDGTNWIVG